MPISLLNKILVLILFMGISGISVAQQTDTSAFYRKLKKIGDQETFNSIEKYKAGRVAIKQQYLFEAIRNTTEQAKIYLKNGLDTIAILHTLNSTNHSLETVNDGVFTNTGNAQTQRNLAVSSAILKELLLNMTREKNIVATYTRDLVNFRDRIDSLSMDSALYTFPKDSLGVLKYLEKIKLVAREIAPVDTALNQALANIQDLHNKVDISVFSLRSALEQIEKYRIDLTRETFSRKFPNITGPIHYSRPIEEIIQVSMAKEKMALKFYLVDNPGRLAILVIMILLIMLYIRSLKKHLIENKGLNENFNHQLVLKYPGLSAIILGTSLFQFVFLDPPFIFSFLLWLVAALCLAVLFHGFISRWWMRFWLVMILFFILAGFDNMILQASREERWYMLALSVAGAAYCLYVLLAGKKYDLKEKGILYFIAFVVVMESGATIFNFFGRYNFGKTLMISGFSGLVIAILFLWTVRLINELLGISNTVYKHPDKKLLFLNFDRIGEKVPSFLYVLLVLGWFILVGRNSYAFREIVTPFNNFLTRDRTLGDYTFTINGLFIFILILVCSMLLSRIISFFAAEPGDKTAQGKPSGRIELGSWLLLVRILIISVGIFLAFAASGIPLDRITIILGALGVGIGLGLQGLVNNLVSGLIIAFEKPVNVGDTIEVNGKPGTMKTIGFRSSVVSMADGAFLIIPNGDLLSQHLVNWSMGKRIKRLTVAVGVAYGSDISLVRQTIIKILVAEERILHSPPAQVLATEFAASSINFEVQFWVQISTESQVIKNDIITLINSDFSAAGIVIPMPQREVHLRPGPGNQLNLPG